MLCHHSSSQEAIYYRTKWQDICGNKVLWETGVEAPEGHHRLPAGPPAVCLPGNRPVDDYINVCLYHILQHLCSPRTYTRILFVGWSPVLNTISVAQGCVLSLLLFSLYINDCISGDPSVKLLKYVDNTAVIGLIQYVMNLHTDRKWNRLSSGEAETTQDCGEMRKVAATEIVLSETAQEVSPVRGAADHLLFCHHPSGNVHIHNCLDQHQRRPVQTARDSHFCRENNQGQTIRAVIQLRWPRIGSRRKKCKF